jgi:hypothetical protein
MPGGVRAVGETVPTAERILSEHFGRGLALQADRVWDGPKSKVIRCRVHPFSASVPASVIIKQSLHGAVLEDWAAAFFLEQVPHDPPFAPRCYGGDPAAQTIVLEDLGDGDSPNTSDLVFGGDPATAATALVEHIGLVGRLHAATTGRQEEYARLRRALGPLPAPKPLYQDPWSNACGKPTAEQQRDRALEHYRNGFRAVGLTAPAAAAGEIEMVTDRVEADPGPYLAFCQGDLNLPGNCVHRAGRLRLYDFDCGGFRHALVEGLAGRLTWGCTARIPAGVVEEMGAAYRTAFQAGCSAARDDRCYRQALVAAAARWHIFHVIWRLPAALERDYPRGPSSLRQQLLAWLEAFVEVADRYGHTPALGGSARSLAGRLRAQWPAEVGELPFYPAFRR